MKTVKMYFIEKRKVLREVHVKREDVKRSTSFHKINNKEIMGRILKPSFCKSWRFDVSNENSYQITISFYQESKLDFKIHKKQCFLALLVLLLSYPRF